MTRRAATEIAVYLAIIAAIIALAGCTPERPAVVLPPAELTTCMAEPIAPALPAKDGTEATQNARDMLTGTYILAIVMAGGDCRAKVAGVKAWRDRMDD